MAIYKDEKRGSWYYQTWIELPDGTRKQKKKRGFKTKKEAKIAEVMAIEEARNAVYAPTVPTFDEVATEYLEWHSARRKQSSGGKIKSIFDKHLTPTYGGKLITDISAGDIMDHQTRLIEKYAGSYISMIHAVLSNFFKYAIKKEYRPDNPAKTAGGPDVKRNKIMNYWTLDEFKVFMNSVDDPFYYTLFMTLYYSGMRKGELLALTWGDIDQEAKEIRVNKTLYRGVVQTPKTAASIRTIGMPTYVMRLLSHLRADRTPEPSLTHRVFGEFHDSISEATLSRRHVKYQSASNVKEIRLHDFRHSHASYLINKGIIISVVAARLGHGDIATTLNTYSHLFPSTEKEAVLAMEGDFEPTQLLRLLP